MPTCLSIMKERLLPVTCVALARVKISALFSSSDSAERTVLGSLRKRVNCGWTSELPKAVISRRAVLSTLEREHLVLGGNRISYDNCRKFK